MGISEFAVHNVLRTYARQERLGQVQRTRAQAASPPAQRADQVNLSPSGRKMQGVTALAAEIVERDQPDLRDGARAAVVRGTQDELLEKHRDEITDDAVTAEAFDARLRSRYLG